MPALSLALEIGIVAMSAIDFVSNFCMIDIAMGAVHNFVTRYAYIEWPPAKFVLYKRPTCVPINI